MIDFIAAIRAESARFSDLIRNTDPAVPVPSCPGWSMADLTWHLAEVQYFWATIATGLLTSPSSIDDLQRPSDASLPTLFDEQTERLVTGLQAHDPSAQCWSWHENGNSIAWVRRRQAHEALVHRVDAELGAGGHFVVDEALAADGVDEVLRVFLDSSNIPDWSSFDQEGTTATVKIDTGAVWSMQLGRFRGTSPKTGNTYDDAAILLVDEVGEPTVTITGVAADLDLWLWGRGSVKTLQIDGDPKAADTIRAAAVAGTQ